MNMDEMLKVLVCPKCKGSLERTRREDSLGFACGVCHLVYPVRDDIPIMLIEEAIAESDWHGREMD